jgi:hypothetical protein
MKKWLKRIFRKRNRPNKEFKVSVQYPKGFNHSGCDEGTFCFHLDEWNQINLEILEGFEYPIVSVENIETGKKMVFIDPSKKSRIEEQIRLREHIEKNYGVADSVMHASLNLAEKYVNNKLYEAIFTPERHGITQEEIDFSNKIPDLDLNTLVSYNTANGYFVKNDDFCPNCDSNKNVFKVGPPIRAAQKANRCCLKCGIYFQIHNITNSINLKNP